jgi:hypothetical protein
MNCLSQLTTRTLFFLGTATLAIATSVRVVTDRAGHGDTTDFTVGILFGIAIVMMLVAWRSGPKQRNPVQ